MQGKVLAYPPTHTPPFFFLNRKNNLMSSITGYKPRAGIWPQLNKAMHSGTHKSWFLADLCLLFLPSPPHPSYWNQWPSTPEGSLFTHARLSSYLCSQTTAWAKGSKCYARFHACRPTDFCLACPAYELAKLAWQSLPNAEEIFGFIISRKPLIFMQLVLRQLSARSSLLLKLAKGFMLIWREWNRAVHKCKRWGNHAKKT